MMKKWLNLLIGILVLIIILLVIKIAKEQRDYEKANQVYEKLQEQVERSAKEIEEGKEKTSYLEELQTQNQDVISWIEIPDTKIKYPVMQTEDNDFYLTHSFEKEENVSGSIYMDFRNDKTFKDQNTVIYGHNMKNGSMFHNLRYFREPDYVAAHPSVFITLDDEILEYEIFSVYVTEANYDYRTPNYKDEEHYEDFLHRINERSMIDTGIKIEAGDKILTLSTCTNDFEDARLAVHARLKK